MQKALTIALVTAALAASLPFVFAGSRSDAVTEAVEKPASSAASGLRMADAADAVVPAYTRGPLIIQVPQPGERARASVNERDPGVSDSDTDDEAVAPPPRRRVAPPLVRTAPRWSARTEPERIERPYGAPPRRVEAPAMQEPRREERTVRQIDMSKPGAEPAPQRPILQPPSPRRAVLSAPPAPAEGPTPIRPTPKFGLSTVSESSPPPGYTPPVAAPHVEEPDDDTAK